MSVQMPEHDFSSEVVFRKELPYQRYHEPVLGPEAQAAHDLTPKLLAERAEQAELFSRQRRK